MNILMIIIGILILFIDYGVFSIYHMFSFSSTEKMNTIMNIVHYVVSSLGLGCLGFGISGFIMAMALPALFMTLILIHNIHNDFF